MRNHRLYTALFFFSIVITTLLSSCGGNQKPKDNVSDETDTTKELVLTMAASHIIEQGWLNEAERTMREKMAQAGYDFHLDLTMYDDIEQYASQLQIMFMSGTGYDLFQYRRALPNYAYAEAGYLADFYELIDRDPEVSLDDYYTNALSAFEYDDKLYVFPLSFAYDYIGINTKLPQSVIDQFKQYSMISMPEIMRFYNEIDHQGLEISNLLHYNDVIRFEINNFVDSTSKTCSFDDGRFVDLLNDMKLAFAQSGQYDSYGNWGDSVYGYMFENAEPLLSEQYVFLSASTRNSPLPQMILPVEDPTFTHLIPVCKEGGVLKIEPRDTYCISKNADFQLAWEFVKQMIPAYSYRDIEWAPISPPIEKALFIDRLELKMKGAISDWDFWGPIKHFIGQGDEVMELQQINNLAATLEEYNAMPMTHPAWIDPSLYENTIKQFMKGLISAEKAATDIQNRISLFLIE